MVPARLLAQEITRAAGMLVAGGGSYTVDGFTVPCGLAQGTASGRLRCGVPRQRLQCLPEKGMSGSAPDTTTCTNSHFFVVG
jgi:hypothetical protein